MKAYIAGKLGTPSERERLETIDALCQSLGLETFLPHRDVGFARSFKDRNGIFKKDISEGLAHCDIIVACLDGLHVGAGTAWELGFAHAHNIRGVGIKSDESPEEAFEYLSSIITASLKIVRSLDDLKRELEKIKISLKA
jgi:nucleoside 2-deoxyribosyltransferase